MTSFIRKVLLILLCAHSMNGKSLASFYNRHAEGWFWYKEEPIQDTETKRKNQEKFPQTSEEKASEKLSHYKKKLEQKLHLALVSPTYTNIKNYMTFQKDMMQRSEAFSRTWQQVVANETSLDQEVQFPTTQYARHVYEKEQKKQRFQVIKRLSQTFGLFYFFKANCAYCEAFAPIVKLFASTYGFDIIAVSVDGSSSSVFERVQQDNGMAAALRVTAVPTLIAYNAVTEDVIPLSHAATSLEQLEETVMALTQSTEGTPLNEKEGISFQ